MLCCAYHLTFCVQTTKIGQLSEGQKSRLVFGMICMQRPNLLLLDEPTNHLDIESIDALADAIKVFNGGLVLVSHDFRLIDQVSFVRCRPRILCVCSSAVPCQWHAGCQPQHIVPLTTPATAIFICSCIGGSFRVSAASAAALPLLLCPEQS